MLIDTFISPNDPFFQSIPLDSLQFTIRPTNESRHNCNTTKDVTLYNKRQKTQDWFYNLYRSYKVYFLSFYSFVDINYNIER